MPANLIHKFADVFGEMLALTLNASPNDIVDAAVDDDDDGDHGDSLMQRKLKR